MPTATVDVHVDFSDFDEEDLVAHLRHRGYLVEKPAKTSGEDRRPESEWRLQRGEYGEALYALARELGPAYRDLPRAIEARS